MPQILSAPLNGAGYVQPAGLGLRNRIHSAQTMQTSSVPNCTQSKINDWDTFQDFLFDERRFPAVILVAGFVVCLSVIGVAFGI